MCIRDRECPIEADFCNESTGGIHRGIHAAMHLIEDHAKTMDIPVRFAASKILEGDRQVLEYLKLTQNEMETLEHISRQTEEETGLDRASAIASMRFDYIQKAVSYTHLDVYKRQIVFAPNCITLASPR